MRLSELVYKIVAQNCYDGCITEREARMKTDLPHSETFPSRVKNFKKVGITKWVLGVFLLGFVAAGSYIVYRQIVIVPRQAAQRQALSVPVERLNLSVTVAANGTIKPERSINVSPKSSGRLKSLLVKEGDWVKQGQIIAYMDDSNLQGQLIEAKGRLAEAQANLQKLVAGNRVEDIAQAQAELQNTQATLEEAASNLRQNEQLFASGAISSRDLITSRAAYNSAKAAVDRAQQALTLQQNGSRPEDIAQARAQVKQAQGALQNIQTQLNDTAIAAPFSGVVAQKYADPGAFVTPTTAGSSVSGATSNSILALAANNQVVANVSESNIAQIRIGQEIRFRADAYPGKTFKGRVNQIAVQSTVEQNVTSFQVKAAILTDPQLLRSGMNVDVDFKAGELKNAIAVPTVAIARQPNGTGVFVASENNNPIFTPIQTGVTVNDKTQVLSGLTGTEKVFITFPPGTRPQTRTPGIPGMGGSRR
ncbi:efflux transporter periplasmic adaptor subunit [Chroococcidiopsis sp. CCALA 051]|nr:efflux transporter periplasmic adaptor subunit [Chroococcidiopsis sp. CCALA 051]